MDACIEWTENIYSITITIGLLKLWWFIQHNSKYLHNTYFWITTEIDFSKVIRWNANGTNCEGTKCHVPKWTITVDVTHWRQLFVFHFFILFDVFLWFRHGCWFFFSCCYCLISFHHLYYYHLLLICYIFHSLQNKT